MAKAVGQPTVLGELVAGVLLGSSVLGLVDPGVEAIHLLAELGVIVLLFAIGLETDLRKLLKVGGASAAVAAVGVALPFALGFAACRLLGLPSLVAIVAGASMTATSVGITARVLSDLGRLQEPESQIILGAAVIDDVIGLVILTVVAGMTRGEEATALGVARITAVAFGFLLGTLVVGSLVVPHLVGLVSRIDLPGTTTILAVILAFGLAWLAEEAGSAVIIGAFAAGLLLAKTPQAPEIEHGVTELGNFFVPIFFVSVGAAVDVRVFNPLDPSNHSTLLVGGLLLVAAVVGKFAAGYAAPWFKGKKSVIGVGMIPRGEVGLIFAQMGLPSGVFDAKLFSAVTLMVMVTTFLARPSFVPSSRPRTRPGWPPRPKASKNWSRVSEWPAATCIELAATGIAIRPASCDNCKWMAERAGTSGVSHEGRRRWPVAELVACGCGRAYEAEGLDARCPGCGRTRPESDGKRLSPRGGSWRKLALGVFGSLALLALVLSAVPSTRESGEAGSVQGQPEADRTGPAQLPCRLRLLPAGGHRGSSRGGPC